MRLDKFLKVSRLIKQRPRAKQLCTGGSVNINDNIAKGSHNVKVGDVITIVVGDKRITAEILEIPTGNVSKKKACELIQVHDIKWLNE